jgi:chromosome segregation ATPase
MYRLCKIFISDITAGENILQNGLVPIFRENGLADHGVLFAANGTCKTTLLSFVLNVFCPDQRRFVQHLQSSGDKTLEQYLIAGRPAVVVLDLATTLAPTLFEAEPVDHLCIGQLLYRHRSAPDKIDRAYFIAQSADFFDHLRRQWTELLHRDQPYKAIRDFLAPAVQQTTSQKEWADNLERLGLDPWLIDRQIDFARTEGGIKDTFKFRSESEFLSFFLGCVADMDAAATLRQTISQSLQKMADRPRKKAQLKAALDLKQQMAAFDGMAHQWQTAREAVSGWRIRLGEAAHLLKTADRKACEQIQAVSTGCQEIDCQQKETLVRAETAAANQLAVQHFRLARSIETGQAQRDQAKADLAGFREEELALKAAGDIAEIRKKQAEVQSKQAALLAAGEELAPVLSHVDRLAAQYHVRLEANQRRVKDEIEALKLQELEAQTRLQNAGQRSQSLREHLEALGTEIGRIQTRIAVAEQSRNALGINDGEAPEEARKRLLDDSRRLTNRIQATQAAMAATDQEIRQVRQRWRQVQRDLLDREQALKGHRERMAQERQDRNQLLSDAHLRRVAGSDDFEPSSAELVSRLDDALARSRDRLAEKQQRHLEIEREIHRLAHTQSLAVDAETQKLIAHYHGQGVSAGELKSFPEYLAGLYEDPHQIAAFIERDPGRFTGLMAATADVLEKVGKLPVPEFLHRPVVISKPCSLTDAPETEQALIRPKDPVVYTRGHADAVRALLKTQWEALGLEIEQDQAMVNGMERSSRLLHRYREQFPERAAVTALSHRIQGLEAAVAALAGDIQASDTLENSLMEQKRAIENDAKAFTVDLTLLQERLRQVTAWIEENSDLQSWYREKEEHEALRVETGKTLDGQSEAIGQIQENLHRLAAGIRGRETELNGLDEQAGDVPRSIQPLTENDRQAALALDLKTIRKLFQDATADQHRLASQLGIETLEKELDALRAGLNVVQTHLNTAFRDQPYNPETAQKWAGKSVSERDKRLQKVSESIDSLRETRIRLESDLKYTLKEQERITQALKDKAADGFSPDIEPDALSDQDPDGWLHRLKNQELRHRQEHQRLLLRFKVLEQQRETLRQWHQEVRLGIEKTSAYEPVWDNGSPRDQWPDLSLGDGNDADVQTVAAFRHRLAEMIAREAAEHRVVEDARRTLSQAFDRLQTDLGDDSFKRHLPAIVDELRHHDAESLGLQCRDLIGRCDDIARNIESDLEISQKIMDNLIDMLLQRSREYHQKLVAASQQTLPDEVFIYGGKAILRAGTRLDFARHSDVFRQCVENWLYELIQQGRLPEVNPKAGNCLGSELLYQLLGASSGKADFGIRLLKCDDTGRNYEPVGKDLGSGGEALTTAVLLYTLLISMRKKRRNLPDERIPAFLLLDNPLGVCNRSDFLDAQLKMARAMGIQCVYLTGINDRESLDLFELRVAIRKGGKKIDIDGQAYDCLEVVELNVEKPHGPSLA